MNIILKNTHQLYVKYYAMRRRCYKATGPNLKNYQEKGIKICQEWLQNKSSFFEWAFANGWEEGLVIDRLDSNRDYEPNNCRFITPSENSRNKIHSGGHKLNIDDVKKIKEFLNRGLRMTEIASLFSVSKSCIKRIKHGETWSNIPVAV